MDVETTGETLRPPKRIKKLAKKEHGRFMLSPTTPLGHLLRMPLLLLPLLRFWWIISLLRPTRQPKLNQYLRSPRSWLNRLLSPRLTCLQLQGQHEYMFWRRRPLRLGMIFLRIQSIRQSS
ncbi:hypothetical protein ACFX2A_031480 [Malus domestica]